MDKKEEKKILHDIEEVFEMNGLKHFIHKQTHELLSYPHKENSNYQDLSFFEDVIQEINQKPEEYIEVEPISTREVFIIMEDFTDTIHNMSHQDALMKALNKENPFRQFRYTLEDIGLLEEWNIYKDKAFKNLAVKWINTYLEE